jgi:chitin synthase
MEDENAADLLIDAAGILNVVQEHEPLLRVRHQRLESTRRRSRVPHLAEEPSLETVSQTNLTKGHYVVDCPIAPHLLSRISTVGMRPHQNLWRNEFTHCRYTAAACDADEFQSSRYTLRPPIFSRPRRTEICIAVTVYNEDEILLGRTLQAILQNIKYLCTREKHAVWNKDAWKRVAVCIIGDGRAKFDQRALSLLAALGLYQDGVAVGSIDGERTQAHIFEVALQTPFKGPL